MPWQPGMAITAQRLRDNTPHTISYTAITANTATSTGTELVALTTSSITFRTGRAYRITLKCLAQSSVAADTVMLRVRKTDTAGVAFLDQIRKYIPANGANAPTLFSNTLTNTTGADVTAVLVATYQRASGTGNSLIAASVNNVAFVKVEDVGSSDDYPGAQAIT